MGSKRAELVVKMVAWWIIRVPSFMWGCKLQWMKVRCNRWPRPLFMSNAKNFARYHSRCGYRSTRHIELNEFNMEYSTTKSLLVDVLNIWNIALWYFHDFLNPNELLSFVHLFEVRQVQTGINRQRKCTGTMVKCCVSESRLPNQHLKKSWLITTRGTYCTQQAFAAIPYRKKKIVQSVQ